MSEKIKGLKDLERKLLNISKKMSSKILRQGALQATTPAMKAMKKDAPKGKKSHRTYKGRLVAPGFLSRSIIRHIDRSRDKTIVLIGVKKEAFYGIQFLNLGTKSHIIKNKYKKSLFFSGKFFDEVSHPGSKKNDWFTSSFVKSEKSMIDKFSFVLNKKIMAL